MYNSNGWECKVNNNTLICSIPLPSLDQGYRSGGRHGDKVENFKRFVMENDSGVCCVYSNGCHFCHELISACKNWKEIESENGANGVLLLCYDVPEDRLAAQNLKIPVNGVPTTVEFSRKGLKKLDRNMFIKLMNEL